MQDITAVWTADPAIQCQDFAKLRHTHTTMELLHKEIWCFENLPPS